MPLLNYTTKIAAEKTAAEIQKVLSQAGAQAIMTEYDNGIMIGITFRIITAVGMTSYKLPCDIPSILKILAAQHRKGKVPKRYVNDEQAARIGWRIIKVWIEAQLALIETEMVTVDQVFLPYAMDHQGNTVYQHFLNRTMGPQITEAK